MQERSLAQRARTAIQNSAKLEANAKVSVSRVTPPAGSISSASEASHYAESGDASASAHSGTGTGGTSSGDDHSSSNKMNNSFLESAIRRGDWRAVGEAAAMMGSGFAVPDESVDSASSYSGSLPRSQNRGYYLDALIAKGDWTGIVHAAATYQAIDDHGVGGSLSTEEEREALAQANYWQEIARQSKTDSSVEATKGAVDAAEWAISLARKRIHDISYESNSHMVFVDGVDRTDVKKPRRDDESV